MESNTRVGDRVESEKRLNCLELLFKPLRILSPRNFTPAIRRMEDSEISDMDLDMGFATTDIEMIRRRRTTRERSSPNSCIHSSDPSGDREFVMVNFMRPDVYRAIGSGDVAFFLRHLRSGNLESWLKQATPRGDTLLHLAAHFEHDELVELLLKYCPTLMERQNSTNVAPLHVAVSAGHLKIVNIMLQYYPETVNLHRKKLLMEYCHEGNTLLHLALINRHETVAQVLFNKVDPQVTHHLNGQRKSPLHMAAESGYVKLFEDMMKKSVDDQVDKIPDEVTKQYRYTLVRAAISGKSRDILHKVLLTWPDFVTLMDDRGMRPLSFAALTGYLEGVDEILQTKTETKVYDRAYCAYLPDKDKSFPIHMASIEGHIEIIQKFIELCPDSKELLNNERQNILHLAAKAGKAKTVSYMLKKQELKMLINEKDCKGNTPLHLAVEMAHPKVVYILTRDSRVYLQLMNNEGRTAVDVALNYSNGQPSFRQRLTWQALKYAGASEAQCTSMIESNSGNSKPDPEETSAPNIINTESFKGRIETLMLVSTLLVTVTFAAGLITLPGSDNSGTEPKEGVKVLFHIFVISNTIAMYSSTSVVVALIWSHLGDLKLVNVSLKYTVTALGLSLVMVSVAFMTGVYLVVSKHTWLAYSVLVLGSIGFLIVFLLFAPLCSPSSLNNRITRCIFYFLFRQLIKVSKSDIEYEKEKQKTKRENKKL